MNLVALYRGIITSILGVLFQLSSNSQTVSFKCNNTTLYKNDFFSISITFSKDGKKEFNAYKNYQFPDIADMAKSHTYFHEKEGSEKTYSIVQWYEPVKVGPKSIPAITVQTKNKTFTNPAFSITILSTDSDTPVEPPVEPWLGKTKLQLEIPEIEWHLESNVSTTYPLQPIHITGYLLTPAEKTIPFTFIESHLQKELLKKKIKNNNCLIQERSLAGEFKTDTIRIEGRKYLKLIVLDQFIFPQKPAAIDIPATEWFVYAYKKGTNDEGVVRLAEKYILKDNAIRILVKELPAFSTKKIMPVGTFYVKDYLAEKRIRNGQATYLTIVLETTADPSSIGTFEFISSDIELMSEEIVSQKIVEGEQWRVRKELKFQINPLRSGQYQMSDAFMYVYFNPATKKYDTLHPKSILNVYGERVHESNAMLTNDEFYNRYTNQTNNKLFIAKENDLFNHLANLIILVMLVVTAILVIKK